MENVEKVGEEAERIKLRVAHVGERLAVLAVDGTPVVNVVSEEPYGVLNNSPDLCGQRRVLGRVALDDELSAFRR